MKKLFLIPVLASTLLLSSCNDYGKKVKISDKTEVYIKGKATEDEAKRLGNYIDTNAGAAVNQRSFQLTKDDAGYTVKMVIDESAYKKDPNSDESFMMIRYVIARDVFAGNHVKMILTNNTFGEIKTVKDTTYTE